MIKIPSKSKLTMKTETVRELRQPELPQVLGGQAAIPNAKVASKACDI